MNTNIRWLAAYTIPSGEKRDEIIARIDKLLKPAEVTR